MKFLILIAMLAGCTSTFAARKNKIVPSIDFTQMQYSESWFNSSYTANKVVQSALTARLFIDHRIADSKFGVGANGFMTAAVLSQMIYMESARFAGAEVNGYFNLISNSTIEMRLVGSAFYRTMFVSNNQYGYRELIGAAPYLTFAKVLSNGKQATIAVKYLPLSYAFTGFDLKNREVSISATYGGQTAVRAEWMSQRFSSDGNTALATQMSLGLLYSFI